MRGFSLTMCAAIVIALVWCGPASAGGATGRWSFCHGEGQTWYDLRLDNPDRTDQAADCRSHDRSSLAYDGLRSIAANSRAPRAIPRQATWIGDVRPSTSSG